MSQDGEIEAKATQPQTEMKIPCEVYTRVVGYLRPTSAFNDGKKQEAKERVVFDLEKTTGAKDAS